MSSLKLLITAGHGAAIRDPKGHHLRAGKRSGPGWGRGDPRLGAGGGGRHARALRTAASAAPGGLAQDEGPAERRGARPRACALAAGTCELHRRGHRRAACSWRARRGRAADRCAALSQGLTAGRARRVRAPCLRERADRSHRGRGACRSDRRRDRGAGAPGDRAGRGWGAGALRVRGARSWSRRKRLPKPGSTSPTRPMSPPMPRCRLTPPSPICSLASPSILPTGAANASATASGWSSPVRPMPASLLC